MTQPLRLPKPVVPANAADGVAVVKAAVAAVVRVAVKMTVRASNLNGKRRSFKFAV
jgi:hypothetical protein